ncbi:hypothetical protein D3C77_105900 [compost metagenome]
MKLKLVGKPKNAPYLTPGKVYPVQAKGPNSAIIEDDDGEFIEVRLPHFVHQCPHARPAVWEVVE